MLRLFLRLYLFLMLPATAAFVGFMYLTDQVMAQVHAEDQRRRAGPASDRAERIITAKEVPDWQGRLREIEKTFRIEHRILPLAQVADDWFMSPSEKARLQATMWRTTGRSGCWRAWRCCRRRPASIWSPRAT